MTPLRVLIVDDEPLARQRLVGLLEGHDVEIAGECGDGLAAVAAIEAQAPDLLFLDVHMPKLDGFGVLEAIAPERMPVTVFVTAYDQYALRAFEVHALDYLLKPFDRERFERTLERARLEIERARASERTLKLAGLLADLQAARPKALDRLVVRANGRVFFLRAGDVDWIEAAANYVDLHVGNEVHLIRETINELAARLDPATFLRIHRSIIVNLDRVKEIQPWFNRSYVLVLRDGTQLRSSRAYRARLHRLVHEQG